MSGLLTPPPNRSPSRALKGGPLDGWMDDDAALAAGQLFSRGENRGILVVNGDQLLGDTARVVGAELGEMHFRIWAALTTIWASSGCPANGSLSFTLGELTRTIIGDSKSVSSRDRDRILEALFDLRDARITLPGYDLETRTAKPVVADTALIISFQIAGELLRAYRRRDPSRLKDGELEDSDQLEDLKALGGRRGSTLKVRLHPEYVDRLLEADLRRFDWSKTHKLSGVGLKLWLIFSDRRIRYLPAKPWELPPGITAQPGETLEWCQVELTPENAAGLGVTAARRVDRRKPLRRGCQQVLDVDGSFAAMEVINGGNDEDVLYVLRRGGGAPTGRPNQLQLTS
ncbi:hypothetical protein GKE82_24125 [Conexibacter sp. W3-3-2]|uniref:hypothetical protein n=1 Tax=Conexibacter sp. W3-3-2 TaxID=2675227 RepID=UPI0012B85A9F|nr:hypothetical protein [Conexibacter sp. W3-3-2]MTD47296.1 hypothetical protein [Conexibacter sp. W3-3-2]